MDAGTVLSVMINEANRGGLTAVHNGLRFFPDREDPMFRRAKPGQRWKVEVLALIKDNLWRIKLLSQEEEEEEAHRNPCALHDRHLGLDTPSHLKLALSDLPTEFPVTLLHQDEKSLFGLYRGIAIRPENSKRHRLGDVVIASPSASGRQGIYARTQLHVEKQTAAISERDSGEDCTRVPEEFHVRFDRNDARGPYSKYEGFIVRPDSRWQPKPSRHWSGLVRVIDVKRRGTKLIFVVDAKRR